MVKLLAFLKARRDLSREQFIDYYENRHVPLIRSIAPQLVSYTRNYLEHPPLRKGEVCETWDVVTELIFNDAAAFEGAMRALAARRADIRADEANFLDVEATKLYQVASQGIRS